MTELRSRPVPDSDSRPSILLVDDDVIFVERLARALRERGYDVRTAQGYDQAMALARAESPELAVVDLRMPGRSGLELVRDLSSVDASTRILVLTGYGSIATAVEAIRLGAKDYLSKPADVDDILMAFRRSNHTQPLAPDAKKAISAEFPRPTLARAEWEHIHRVLSDCHENVSEAARRLGIHRRSLRKLQKYPPKELAPAVGVTGMLSLGGRARGDPRRFVS